LLFNQRDKTPPPKQLKEERVYLELMVPETYKFIPSQQRRMAANKRVSQTLKYKFTPLTAETHGSQQEGLSDAQIQVHPPHSRDAWQPTSGSLRRSNTSSSPSQQRRMAANKRVSQTLSL
jgi:hypothetical protein